MRSATILGMLAVFLRLAGDAVAQAAEHSSPTSDGGALTLQIFEQAAAPVLSRGMPSMEGNRFGLEGRRILKLDNRTRRGMTLWGLMAVVAVAPGEVKAAPPAPKIYAFCVEAGVPGLSPRPAGELARLLRETAFDGVGYSHLADPHFEEDLRAFEAAGLQLYLAQTPINLDPQAPSPYDVRVPDAIRKLKGRPTTVVVNICGLKPGDPAGMESAVRSLRELGDVAAEANVRVSVYNHVDNWSESVAFCVEVVKKTAHPQVGFNFNLCHWLKVEGDKDYRPLLRANAEKLFCVTICGAQVGAQAWTNGLIQPLDRGDFDNRALLDTLREIGYEGPVGIMCYGIPGDAREYLQRSMQTWKRWFSRP